MIGKVPTPSQTGPVKDAAARFNKSDWEAVASLRGPAPAAWPDFGFWFNYFWDEAVTVEGLTNAEKQMLVETFHGVFAKAGGGWQMRTDPQAKESYHRLKMLRNLLHVGFVRVPYETGGPKGVRPVTAEVGTKLFKEEVRLFRDPGNSFTIKIGWRCDSRPYELLVSQNGFQARARQEKVDREWNLTQPWHPYSLDVYRTAIYLRRGKNYDNCLHTAVSVGTEFKALVHFPLFTDTSLYTYPAGPINNWASPLVVNTRGEKARVGKDEHGSYLEHDTQLYALRIDDSVKGFDTQAFQRKAGKDPFPERSVDAIPVENILGRVLITRKYWWDARGGGWEFFDIECKTIDIVGKTIADYRVGPYAERVLKTHIQTQVTLAKTRQDIVFARAKRVKELTAPQAQGRGAQKVCPKCQKSFAPVMYNMHVNQCNG